MKHILKLLFSMLLPVLLFSNVQQPSYAIQTDKRLSPQTIIAQQETLFSSDTTLLRDSITPNSVLWIKDILPNNYFSEASDSSTITQFKEGEALFYRIQNPSLSLLIELESLSKPHASSHLIAWIAGNAFYYAIVFLLIIYGWFFYSLAKHTSLKYYLSFHIVFALLLLSIDGWIEKIVWSNILSARPYIIALGIGLSMFLLTHFTRRLLKIEKIEKLLDQVLSVLGIVNLVLIPIIIFLPQDKALLYIATLAFVTSMLLLASILYILLSGKSLSPRSHLLLWSALLAMIGVDYLRHIGILPSNIITLLALKIILIIELPIISTAILRDRFIYLEREGKTIEAYKEESENEISRNILDKKRLQQRHDLLNKLAGVDSLTGLLNRREFFNISESLIFKSKISFDPYALMMLDIDHFKNVNDTYGHDVGDIVLKGVTKAVDEQKRSNDIFGRIGGEEFAIFMPNTVAKDAEILANKICKSVSQLIIDGDGKPITVTISIGITSDGNRDLTLSEIMKSSDDALYEAKNNGRNRVVAREALPH